MTYTKETGKKWENEHGKTSHMKVLMVNDAEECEKECTATVLCIAYTFIPGMEICALKAPKDAVTSVSADGAMISGKLDGERPSVHGKELETTICLSCLPGFLCYFQWLILFLRVQCVPKHKVLRPQLVPTGSREPGRVCSRLSSGA